MPGLARWQQFTPFTAAIRAAADDPLPWMLLADRLDEMGDHRGPWIRAFADTECTASDVLPVVDPEWQPWDGLSPDESRLATIKALTWSLGWFGQQQRGRFSTRPSAGPLAVSFLHWLDFIPPSVADSKLVWNFACTPVGGAVYRALDSAADSRRHLQLLNADLACMGPNYPFHKTAFLLIAERIAQFQLPPLNSPFARRMVPDLATYDDLAFFNAELFSDVPGRVCLRAAVASPRSDWQPADTTATKATAELQNTLKPRFWENDEQNIRFRFVDQWKARKLPKSSLSNSSDELNLEIGKILRSLAADRPK